MHVDVFVKLVSLFEPDDHRGISIEFVIFFDTKHTESSFHDKHTKAQNLHACKCSRGNSEKSLIHSISSWY